MISYKKDNQGNYILTGDTFFVKDWIKNRGGTFKKYKRTNESRWTLPYYIEEEEIQKICQKAQKRKDKWQRLKDASFGDLAEYHGVYLLGNSETFKCRSLLNQIGKWNKDRGRFDMQDVISWRSFSELLNFICDLCDADYDNFRFFYHKCDSTHRKLESCDCSDDYTCDACRIACCEKAVIDRTQIMVILLMNCPEHGKTEKRSTWGD